MGTGPQPCRFQARRQKGPTTSWLGTKPRVLTNVSSSKRNPRFTYRRLEPGEEGAHGGGIAGDLAACEARGRAGGDWTKDAALSESMERGMGRGTAARQSTSDGR